MNVQVTCNEHLARSQSLIEEIAWKGLLLEGKSYGGRRTFSGEKSILMGTMVRLLGSLRSMLDVKMIVKAKKDYGDLKDELGEALFGILGGYKAGHIGVDAIEGLWKGELKTAWGKAYELGGRSVGNPYGVFEEDLTWLKGAEVEEFGYLGKFVKDLKNGTLGMEAEERLKMYAETLDGVYHHGQVVGSPDYVKIHWKLHEARHCNECIKFAANSPYTKRTLPAVPRDGTSRCLSYCQCTLVFEYVEKVPEPSPMIVKGPKPLVVPEGYRLPTHKERDKLGIMSSEIDRLRAMIDATKGADKKELIGQRRDLNAELIDFMERHKVYYVPGMQLQKVKLKESVEEVMKHPLLLLEGGPGSGHWGHKGRPGHRGGSQPRGEAGRVSSTSMAKYLKAKETVNPETGEVILRGVGAGGMGISMDLLKKKFGKQTDLAIVRAMRKAGYNLRLAYPKQMRVPKVSLPDQERAMFEIIDRSGFDKMPTSYKKEVEEIFKKHFNEEFLSKEPLGGHGDKMSLYSPYGFYEKYEKAYSESKYELRRQGKPAPPNPMEWTEKAKEGFDGKKTWGERVNYAIEFEKQAKGDAAKEMYAKAMVDRVWEGFSYHLMASHEKEMGGEADPKTGEVFLHKKVSIGIAKPYNMKPNSTIIRRVEKTIQKVNEYVHPAVMETSIAVRIIDVTSSKYRANATGQSMSIANNDNSETIVHETGHILENGSRGLNRAMNDFVASRGGETINLKSISRSYKGDEIAKKDKFLDPYVGKIYKTGETEVMSVGLARMTPWIVEGAKGYLGGIHKDPEHMMLMFAAMKGKI